MDSAPEQEISLSGFGISLWETQTADFAWQLPQKAMGFVAMGLHRSTEGQELEKASLVLGACLTPLCTPQLVCCEQPFP